MLGNKTADTLCLPLLEGLEFDDNPGSGIDLPDESAQTDPVIPEKTHKERIEGLYAAMPTYQRTLSRVITFCEIPRRTAEVDAKLDELQEYNKSVYDAGNLCAIMEENQALIRVNESGDALPEAPREPDVVEEDGVQYLQPKPRIEVCFMATVVALARVAAEDHHGKLMERMNLEPQFKPIYKRILQMCDVEGGISMSELDQALFDAKLLRDANLYPQRFVDKLESFAAIEWKGSWFVTETGTAALRALADAEEEIEFAESEE